MLSKLKVLIISLETESSKEEDGDPLRKKLHVGVFWGVRLFTEGGKQHFL